MASWSAVSPLSQHLIKFKSKPVKFPNFTRGRWEEERKLVIMKPESYSRSGGDSIITQFSFRLYTRARRSSPPGIVPHAFENDPFWTSDSLLDISPAVLGVVALESLFDSPLTGREDYRPCGQSYRFSQSYCRTGELNRPHRGVHRHRPEDSPRTLGAGGKRSPHSPQPPTVSVSEYEEICQTFYRSASPSTITLSPATPV